jgi:peptidoglycan hydrolase-like protein with peptidoglycan-binding domain
MTHGIFVRAAVLGAGIALAAAPVAHAQRVSLPAGSVIIVRTTSPLQSATVRAGETFTTDVEESIGVDEYTVIPSGSHIRGVVSTVRPATRQQSGVIEVAFDQLTLANGSTVAIRGKLTSTDSAERRQIKANPNARVALVGARGGIGAAIAGAGSGAGATSLLSALGGLLSEGRDVDVPAGTPLAVELETSVFLRGGRRAGGTDDYTIYTATNRIVEAQRALAQKGYYRGAATGRLDEATRRALFQFQADQRFNATGNLDGRTARALGISMGDGMPVVTGAVLSGDVATSVRRDATTITARERAQLGIGSNGRADGSRTYAQADVDLWFALAGFAENAATYEELVRSGGSQNASVVAGRSLLAAARRVDVAMQATRVTSEVQQAWSSLRSRLTVLE